MLTLLCSSKAMKELSVLVKLAKIHIFFFFTSMFIVINIFIKLDEDIYYNEHAGEKEEDVNFSEFDKNA